MQQTLKNKHFKLNIKIEDFKLQINKIIIHQEKIIKIMEIFTQKNYNKIFGKQKENACMQVNAITKQVWKIIKCNLEIKH